MPGQTPRVQLSVLGVLTIRVDGADVDVPPGNQRRLLAALTLAHGRPVSPASLVHDVWGPDSPADPKGSLHTTVARLRRTLGRASSMITLGPAGYAFGGAGLARDDDRARDLISRAEATTGSARLGLVEGALGLWRGPAWSDVDDDLALGPATAAEELRLRATQLRAATLLELGRPVEAVDTITDVVTADPLRENSVLILVRALDAAGRIADAVAAFDRYRRELAQRLGLDPSAVMQQEHQRLLHRGERAIHPTEADAAHRGPEPRQRDDSALVGREQLIAEVVEFLTPGCVLTLVGPGGVGKTSVAERIHRGWDPSLWVDLAPVRTGSGVPTAVLGAMGESDHMGTTTWGTVLDRLSGWTGLLVLDNCEHLLNHLVGLVEELLGRAPLLRVLATSREPLGSRDEHLIRVPTLDVGRDDDDPPSAGGAEEASRAEPGSAERLFMLRAGSVAPVAFESAGSRRLVTRICRHLDGLPLAIELAAARVASVSLDDLAEHLGQHLDLLSSARSRHGRHRALRDTVRWSYDQLDDVHQQVFRALSVFAAGFDLAGPQRVLLSLGLPSGEIVVAVSDLTRQSLLEGPGTHGTGRYRMLVPVRHFADEELSAAERSALEAAHSRWAADLAEQADLGAQGREEVLWADRIQALMPDLRRAVARGDDDAVRIAVALSRWGYLSLTREVWQWAAELLAGRRDPPLGLLTAAASGAWLDGDMPRSAQLVRQVLQAPHPVREDQTGLRARDLAWDLLGDNGLITGDLDQAAAAYPRAADGACRGKRVADESTSWCGLACTEAFGGSDALASAQRSVDLARQCGNPSALGMAHYAMGEALTTTDIPGAMAQFVIARDIIVGPRPGLAHAVSKTAIAALHARGQPNEVATISETADTIEHWAGLGESHFLATQLRNAIPVLARNGELELARELNEALSRGLYDAYGREADHLAEVLALPDPDGTGSNTPNARSNPDSRSNPHSRSNPDPLWDPDTGASLSRIAERVVTVLRGR